MSDLYEKRLAELTPFEGHVKDLEGYVGNRSLLMNIAVTIKNQSDISSNPTTHQFIRKLGVLSTFHALASLPNELFSIQTALTDKDYYYYFEKAGDSTSITSKQSKPETFFSLALNGEGQVRPSEVMTRAIDTALVLADEICHSVLNLIKTKAKHVVNLRESDRDVINKSLVHYETDCKNILINSILESNEVIHKSIGRSATFIVMPVSLAKKLKSEIACEFDFDALPISLRRVGVLRNRWVVYVYNMPEIIMGYRGLHYADSGATYIPQSLMTSSKKSGSNWMISKTDQVVLPRKDYFSVIDWIPRTTDAAIPEFV